MFAVAFVICILALVAKLVKIASWQEFSFMLKRLVARIIYQTFKKFAVHSFICCFGKMKQFLISKALCTYNLPQSLTLFAFHFYHRILLLSLCISIGELATTSAMQVIQLFMYVNVFRGHVISLIINNITGGLLWEIFYCVAFSDE